MGNNRFWAYRMIRFSVRYPSQHRCTFLFLTLCLVLAGVGCGSLDNQDRPQVFTRISASEAQQLMPEEDLYCRSLNELRRWLLENTAIKQVEELYVTICVVDATASLDEDTRRRILVDGSRRVALAPPEEDVWLILVSGMGEAADVPQVYRPASNRVTRCIIHPRIPSPDPGRLSSLFVRQINRVRVIREAQCAECNREIAAARDSAKRKIVAQANRFVDETVARLGQCVFMRTDLLGTISRCRALVEDLERRVGTTASRIRIEVISDLVDDANGIRFESRGNKQVRVECPSPLAGGVEEFLGDPRVRTTFYEVQLSTTPKANIENRRSRWIAFWKDLAPSSEVTLWVPETLPDLTSKSGNVSEEGGI